MSAGQAFADNKIIAISNVIESVVKQVSPSLNFRITPNDEYSMADDELLKLDFISCLADGVYEETFDALINALAKHGINIVPIEGFYMPVMFISKQVFEKLDAQFLSHSLNAEVPFIASIFDSEIATQITEVLEEHPDLNELPKSRIQEVIMKAIPLMTAMRTKSQ